MNIEIDGLGNLNKWIEERVNKAKNTEQLKDDIGILIQSDIDNNFEKEQTPEGVKWESYAPWSEVTEDYRAKHGKEFGKMLNFNNDLRMAVEYERTGYGVKSGVLKGPAYSRIHQLGGYAGKGRKVYIPARPYIGLSVSLSNKIIRLVEEHT